MPKIERPHSGIPPLLVTVAMLLTVGGCGRPATSPYAQRDGESFAVSLPAGGPAGSVQRRPDGFAWPGFPRIALTMPGVRSKLVAPLGDWVRDSSGKRRVEVVIGYVDPVVFPRLPVEDLESGDTLALRAAQDHASAVADSVLRLRERFYRPERTRLVRDFGARIEGSRLVTASIQAELALSDVTRLARSWQVRSIHLAGNETGAPPPQGCPDPDTAPDGDAFPCEARHRIGTDPYRNAGASTGRIVLLDTGVDIGHSMFSAPTGAPPSPGVVAYDCWRDPNCASELAGDLHRAFGGHGTKSASLLVGTAAHGDSYEGVTRSHLTAYRVYHHVPGSDPSKAAFDLPAYQRAVDVLLSSPPGIVLAEVQDTGGVSDDAALAADQLFDAGAAVIAPVGNAGDLGTGHVSGSPAISARVLAVGARETRDYGITWTGQASGAVVLCRRKPDLQAPTSTLGASTFGPDEFSLHPKTSGAAPYAAGAARIVRNLLRLAARLGGTKPEIDPGQVYATLIAVASNSAPFPMSEGAGPFRLPASGSVYFGKTTVTATQVRQLAIPVGTSFPLRCRVAIWWPDPRPIPLLDGLLWLSAHHDVDLEARFGTLPSRTSADPNGVFERLTLSRPRSRFDDVLNVKIKGVSTPLGSQTVYWVVVVSPN